MGHRPLRHRSGHSRWLLVVASLFFFSGAGGLIYEVVWMRLLVNVFGASTLAVTTVLAAFMAGLAIGSYAFGRLADRATGPLRVYGLLQVGIGLVAFAIPLLVGLAERFYPSMPEAVTGSFWLLSLIRFGWCVLILIVPTALMGGTLPVLTRWAVRTGLSVGRGAGTLYAINTFGAVLGAAAAGFYLVPRLGLSAGTAIAAGANVAIGAVVLAAARRAPGAAVTTASAAPEGGARPRPRLAPEPPGALAPTFGTSEMPSGLILLLIAVAGFCSLAYEVLWTRVLIVFMPSTTFAFTTMLTTFLLGIAVGSALAARVVDRLRSPAFALGVVEAGIAVGALATLSTFGRFSDLATSLAGGQAGWPRVIVGQFLLAFIIMIVPTLLMGAAFPLAARIRAGEVSGAGRTVGSVYAANTVGSILGSFAAGFVLIPALGIQISIALAAAGNLAVAFVALRRSSGSSRTRLTSAAAAVVAAVILVVIAPFGVPIALSPIIGGFRDGDSDVVFYDEGVSATVTVIEDPARNIQGFFIDRWPVVGTSHDGMRTVKLLAHLPIAAATDARDVAVIGYGMGMTAWTISLHPDVERIDVVELSEGVLEASHFFESVNHNVLEDPRVRLVVGDGRNHLAMTKNRYDVISCDPIHPTLGSGALYTREFFELMRDHLKPGGAAVQYLPFHKLSHTDFAMLIRTFQSVFPHGTVWNGSGHGVLLGTVEPTVFDIDRLERMKAESPELAGELERWGFGDPADLLSCYLLDERGAAAVAGTGPLNTDDTPFIEFSEPRSYGRNTVVENLRAVLAHDPPLPEFRIAAAPDVKSAFRDRVERSRAVRRNLTTAILAFDSDDAARAVDLVETALEAAPEDVDARAFAVNIIVPRRLEEARRLISAGRQDEAVQMCIDALALDPDSVQLLMACGVAHASGGRPEEAAQYFRRALSLQPTNTDILVALARAYEAAGNQREAASWYLKLAEHENVRDEDITEALALLTSLNMYGATTPLAEKFARSHPRHVGAWAVLGQCYLASGRPGDAVEALEKALKIEPGNPSVLRLLGSARAAQGGQRPQR
jgi:spermidine synthase